MAIAPLPVAEQSEMPERYISALTTSAIATKKATATRLICFFDVPGSQYERAGGCLRRSKTTVTKLLMRYADPQQGQILLAASIFAA